MRAVFPDLQAMDTPQVSVPDTPPVSPEALLARAEHRLLIRIMVYRAVVLSVALLVIWEGSLAQTLITLGALAAALGVGQLVYRSQLAWTRHRFRREALRRAKAEAIALEAAAREAAVASGAGRKGGFFDWDDEDGARDAGPLGRTPAYAAAQAGGGPARQ